MIFQAANGTNERVCGHSECSKSLRVDNRTGFCAKHKNQVQGQQQCSYASCEASIRSGNKTGLCSIHCEHAADRQKSHPAESQVSAGTSAVEGDLDESTLSDAAEEATAGLTISKQLTWPMVMCSYCNVSSVNALTNEKRKCQACAKVAKRSNTESRSSNTKRKHDDYAPFSFASGSKRALKGSYIMDGRASSSEKATNCANLFDLIPIAINVQTSRSVPNATMQSFALVTQSFVNDMSNAGITFNSRNEQGTIVQATMQLPEEDDAMEGKHYQHIANSIDTALKEAGFNKLLELTGSFEQPDDDLLDMLNNKFHEHPELLASIAELLTSAVVRHKGDLIKVLTVEAYSRHASLDVHCESQELESSYPKDGRIFCGTVPTADGKGLKHKFIIGSNTMNVLCTCSVKLDRQLQVSIGPAHASKLDPQYCQAFLATAAVANFKKTFSLANNQLLSRGTPLISQLRQTTTTFHHPTTFNTWRRTFRPFNDILHMPATVYTLCDLPSFSGYGANATSVAMLASQLLAAFARACMYDNSMLSQDHVAVFTALYDAVAKDTKPWTPLRMVVEQLKIELKETSQVNVSKFAYRTSLSAVADAAGDVLAVANSKLATNISMRFANYFLA